ncbi:MAG: hypothetical protein ABFR36_10735 [Acidobacteriota bacterium]
MKKLILVLIVLATLVILPSCKFNGEATVIVRNIGDLSIRVTIERSTVALDPGEEEEFKLTWPGKDDINSNLSYSAIAYQEILWDSINFWIKDGETKIFELEYYTPEITR